MSNYKNIPEISLFEKDGKSFPILCLNKNSKWKFSFGIGKAKLILEQIEVIKEFVADPEGATKKYQKQQKKSQDPMTGEEQDTPQPGTENF